MKRLILSVLFVPGMVGMASVRGLMRDHLINSSVKMMKAKLTVRHLSHGEKRELKNLVDSAAQQSIPSKFDCLNLRLLKLNAKLNKLRKDEELKPYLKILIDNLEKKQSEMITNRTEYYNFLGSLALYMTLTKGDKFKEKMAAVKKTADYLKEYLTTL